MIRNQWYAVLDSSQVKTRTPLGVTRMGEKLVFWRDSHGTIVCMRDLCPHIGAQLSQGKIQHDTLACPFHGFEYDSSGACVYLPALGRNGEIPKAMKVVTVPTYEARDYIWIWWGEPEKISPAPRWFENIDESFLHADFEQSWPVHYSRMVENQLDAMHLPFIHSNTIGAGGKTIVEGPLVLIEDDIIKVWVFNKKDDGTPPRRADQLQKPDRAPFLYFAFPNMWENNISPNYKLTAAFVPVDEENSIIKIRSWQRIVKTPILKDIAHVFMNWGSIYITNQDRRVVTRQLPKKTSLKKIGEKLTQGDRGILVYRTRRHELKVENGQDV